MSLNQLQQLLCYRGSRQTPVKGLPVCNRYYIKGIPPNQLQEDTQSEGTFTAFPMTCHRTNSRHVLNGVEGLKLYQGSESHEGLAKIRFLACTPHPTSSFQFRGSGVGSVNLYS